MDSNKQTSKSSSKKNVQFSKKDEGKLKEFFVDGLKDIYFAEDEILKGLKKMESAATSDALKSDVKKHQTETQEHVKRLKEVFKLLGEKAEKKKCDAIMGILKEGEGALEDTEDGSMVRDVAIIIACQKVEHYEIATYGSLSELARTLGLHDAAEILEKTLMEEKSTDLTLTQLAVDSVNKDAKSE